MREEDVPEEHFEKILEFIKVFADRYHHKKEEELIKGFEKVEREIIGEGKHEEFHELLHHLKKVYLRRYKNII